MSVANKTCAQIIDETIAMLHGYGSSQDFITPLTAPIGPTDTTFKVDFTFGQAAGITPGFVEIDSEQLYVTTVDPSTGICTLANGFGRGYGDTVAVSHAAGALVKSQPRFPRIWVFNQLNEVINDVFPDIFTVDKFTTSVQWPNNTYPLPIQPPADVIGAQWQDTLGRWINCHSFMYDPFDGTFRLANDGILIGRPLRILYTTPPSPFVAETDIFAQVTGMPVTCDDVLILGVAARQVPGLDISRAQTSTVEASDRSRVVPPNAGITAGKYLQALYEERLHNEAVSLRAMFKPRIVRVW